MHIIRKYLYFIITFTLFSCIEHQEANMIGETEYYFDEKLSSISSDENGCFWVGSETGDVFKFKDNQRIAYDLGEDRIYKIKREIINNRDTIFWIGVRNSGLQKWKFENNKFNKLKTYTIKFKQDKYSPYDFICSDSIIYIATSQGIYLLDKEHEPDTLSLIYPSEKSLMMKNGNSFITHNIFQYNDSLILASTPNGTLLYNQLNKKSKLILENHNIEHVSIYNDTIFTVSKNHLYLNNLNGDLINKIKTGDGPRVYFQTKGIHYLIGEKELLLSNNLKDFLSIPLRRLIPMGCRNIILPDTLNNFTYLLTNNAVWRIPNDIDVFKGNKTIKTSCSNSDNIYYLSLQNELYVQNKKSDKAKWIATFPKDNLIQWMDISGNDLYFYNVNNTFQKMRISDNWIKNIIFNSPQDIIQSNEKITSACLKYVDGQTYIYLGIQDGMVIVDQNKKVDTISRLSNAYITSMFSHPHTDRLYISTLNDGVFYLNQNNQIKQVPKTENTFFIKDIIATNDHNSNLIILTNQQIISQRPYDSLRVKGYRKLLYANDSVFYALPEFGFHKFTISKNKIIDHGLFYKDIQINPNSSFSSENQLILGSNAGTLILPVGKEEKPVWVQFEKPLNISLIHFISLIFLVLILVSIFTIIILKKQNTDIIQIRKRKEDLAKRIDDLINFYSLLAEIENKEVLQLKEQVDLIEVNSKSKNEANTKLENFSLQIAKLNRKIALLIPKKLEEQIEQIAETDSFEVNALLKLSNEDKAKNDIELIKDRIRLNEIWLQQRSLLFDSLLPNISKFSDCVEIEGVNKELYDNLIFIQENDKFKPLSDLISLYKKLEIEINKVNSAESQSVINSYIDNARTYLDTKISEDKGLSFILESLNDILFQYSDNNITLLKHMKETDNQITTLRSLDLIRNKTIEYKEKYNLIIKNNNKQINKKFDKELSSYINDNTLDVTRSINNLISSLYSHLLNTDRNIVIDILKLTNVESQNAKVLALLISDLKIKRILIPSMLGIYGNLNPVISRLINDRIRVNEDILRMYQKSNENKSVFVHFILKLLD